MKTPILNIKNKGILFLIISSIISHSLLAQNKAVSVVSSINFTLVVPVVFVFGLAVFLFTAFMKQKN